MNDGKRKRNRLVAAAMATLLLVGLIGAASLDAKKKDRKKKPPKAAAGKLFDVVKVAGDFQKPTAVDFTPEGAMLVSEKPGKIWIVDPDGVKRLLLDIGRHTANGRERGLESLDVAHDFATSRRVYLAYTYQANDANPTGPQAMRVTYIKLNSDFTLANPTNPETVVLGKDADRPCPPVSPRRDCPTSIAQTHQGGTILSAPDGTLWIGWGDSNLPSKPGPQTFRTYNENSTSGKLIHVDDKGNGLPGHPFCRRVTDLTRTCTKVFAKGFRNPFRFALTPDGGPVVSDVGWNSREEVDVVKAGKNYGWPCWEGNVRTPFYKDKARCKKLYKQGGTAKPNFTYPVPAQGAGAAAIMGPFYTSGPYPASFNNSFFLGDYAQGWIKRIKFGKGGAKLSPVVTGVRPVHMNFAPDGNLVFLDFRAGNVNKLVFAPNNKAPTPVISANPSSGQAPLGVGFSAAGSTDPDGDPITFEWDFGDGSAKATGSAVSHTYTANGKYNVKLTARDGRGGVGTANTSITVGNTAPIATIIAPKATTLYRGGQPLALQATGSDPEDGALPSGAFKWDVTLVHKQHEHPVGIFPGSSTSFVVPRDHDADSYFEIELKVTDSGGLTTTMPRLQVRPETVPIRIVTSPRRAPVSYGGRPIKAPRNLIAAVGFAANLSAPKSFERGGRTFTFKGWSQGGDRAQIFQIPDHRVVLKAKFK